MEIFLNLYKYDFLGEASSIIYYKDEPKVSLYDEYFYSSEELSNERDTK